MHLITRLAFVSFIAALMSAAHTASAFSTDDTTLSTPQAAQRFSDPDEQTPTGLLTVSPSALFGQNNGNGDSAPNSYGSSAASFSGATPAQGDIELRSRH